MKVKSQVESVNTVPVPANVSFQGQEVKAMVDCVEVQLRTVGPHGNITLRFMGGEGAEVKDLVKAGDSLVLSISKE